MLVKILNLQCSNKKISGNNGVKMDPKTHLLYFKKNTMLYHYVYHYASSSDSSSSGSTPSSSGSSSSSSSILAPFANSFSNSATSP